MISQVHNLITIVRCHLHDRLTFAHMLLMRIWWIEVHEIDVRQSKCFNLTALELPRLGMAKDRPKLGQPDRTGTISPSKWAFHDLGPSSVLDRVEKNCPSNFFIRFSRSCSVAVLMIPRSGGFAVLVIPCGGFSVLMIPRSGFGVLVTSQDLFAVFNHLFLDFHIFSDLLSSFFRCTFSSPIFDIFIIHFLQFLNYQYWLCSSSQLLGFEMLPFLPFFIWVFQSVSGLQQTM